jgi:hypothetical protein
MTILTRQEILAYSNFTARKVATDKIRPFTEDDVSNVRGEFQQDDGGTFFLDLEGRRHQVILGRCLCIGTSPEDRRTTPQEKVDLYRYPVSDEDEEGFRFYRLKAPRSLTCYDISHPFLLDNENGGQLWHCPDPTGGYVVWDLQPANPMRVVQRAIFDQTYERV